MENGKKMIQELQKRKAKAVQQIKDLEKQEHKNEISKEEYLHRRREVERELVEIMDRLTQLGFIFKA